MATSSPLAEVYARGAQEMLAALQAVGAVVLDVPNQAVIGHRTVPIELLDKELASRGLR